MKRYFTLIISLLAVCAAWAVSRDYTLNLTVTGPEGVVQAGQPFSLYCAPYSVYYPASECKLDADGHASLKLYPGEHVLTIDIRGMQTVEQAFDMQADRDIVVALENVVQNPYALDYSLEHDIFTGRNDVTVCWNGDEVIFSDDFESYEPFALSWGDWSGIDGDGHFADAMTGDYANRGLCNYGQVMNPLKVKPVWDIKYYWTLAPRSGDQYIGFVQNSDGAALNDWVITPAITLTDGNKLRFYVKSADAVDAKFAVGITEALNPTAADFTMIHTGNYISAPYSEWTEVVIPLDAYAGRTVRIGINCISPYGTVMSMLDDIFVGRLNSAAGARARRVAYRSPANPYESFIVTLDGVEVGRTDDYSYTFENLQPGVYTIGVQAVYSNAQSEVQTINVAIDAASYAEVDFTTATDNAAMPAEYDLHLADSDGADYTVMVVDGAAKIKSLPVGRYVLTAEVPYYQPYEATVDITAETASVAVDLREARTAPFNVIHTASAAGDGSFDVDLSWNNDLGFTDGFEDYDDFATSWGDWVTYDFNSQASYPIALGSYTNEVSFPGASTSANRVPVPPMIFNPEETTPQLSVDEAFAAVFGKKFVLFQGPANAQADKWIISPEIKVYDDYEWSIIAKAYTIYPETIQMCVSEGGTNPDDFVVLDTIELPYEQWTKFVIDLSAYKDRTLRFAVHCISYDGFVCQVDEFCVGRKGGATGSLDAGNVLSYDLSLDGAEAVNTAATAYTFSGVAAGAHTVALTANYTSGASEQTLYSFTLEASGLTEVLTPDETVDVYNLQGICVARAATAADLRALPSGLYITRKGKIRL